MVTIVDNTEKKEHCIRWGKNKIIKISLKDALNSVEYIIVLTGHLWYI